jgi:hypothetical protein
MTRQREAATHRRHAGLRCPFPRRAFIPSYPIFFKYHSIYSKEVPWSILLLSLTSAH